VIDDPSDAKPSDWVDEEMIEDADARKPADWDDDAPEYIPDPDQTAPPDDWLADEPRFIADPDAVRPDDWDEDIHGEWEAPTVANPKCEAGNCGEWEPPLIENPQFQGKWAPPQIKNPAYKGEWKARQIPNPDYYEDSDPYAKFPPLVGAGFELWVYTNDIAISNVYIGSDETALRKWNEGHFLAKHSQQANRAKPADDKGADSGGGGGTAATPAPRPTLRAGGDGALGALQNFVLNLKDLGLRLYNDNPEATMIVTVVVVGLPTVFCLFGGREPEPQQRVLTPEEKKARRRARKAAREAKAAQAKAAEEAAAEGAGTAATEGESAGESPDQPNTE
jgi:calnexin